MAKPWQKALGDIRVLGPDLPKFNADVKLVWEYIQDLERAMHEALDTLEEALK